jgi:hypothetical protein
MSAVSLIEDLRRRGVVLLAMAGKLRVDAPRGVLTEALRRQLTSHRPEIPAVLAAQTGEAARSDPIPVTDIPAADILTPAAAEALVEHYTERSAIAEFDGGLPRQRAEACARKVVFQGRHIYQPMVLV